MAIGVGKVSDLADHCIRHLPLPVAGFATMGIGQTVSEQLSVYQSLMPLIQHGSAREGGGEGEGDGEGEGEG